MTNTERIACEELVRSSKLATDEDFDRYVTSVKSLSASTDPEVLGVMLDCLNSVDAGEIQYELIEAAERFPDDIYAREVLARSRQLVDRAGIWGWMVLQTMLNTSSCFAVAVQVFSQVDEAKRTEIVSVLNELCRLDSRYEDHRRLLTSA